MKDWLPSAPQVVREALIVMGGALLAAYIFNHWPAGRDYVKNAWQRPTQPGL